MGWASGSELAQEVWDLFEDIIPSGEEKQYALKLVDMFENMDCDTLSEEKFYQIWIKEKY